MSMKKDKRRLSALVFIILFCISVVAAAPFLVFGLLKDQEKSPDLPVLSDSYHLLMNTPDNADAPLLRPTGIDDATDETAQTTDSMVQTQTPPASTDAPTPPPKPPVLTGRSLLIGDSRTIGLKEYGNLTQVDYFAQEGLSIYRVLSEPENVEGVGEVMLSDLLAQRQYDMIFVTLGINELGYQMEQTVRRYTAFINQLHAWQPQATIWIQANLHVSASKSASDEVFNNPAIDRFNNAIASLADGDKIRYIDPNPLFDDGSGGLRAECTFDDIHIYAKYYPQWCDWLREQTGVK